MTRRDDDYAAAHAVMTWQREERRQTGRPMRSGDFVQDETGGDIREVVDIGSAGDCMLASANERARQARENKGE